MWKDMCSPIHRRKKSEVEEGNESNKGFSSP